MEPHADTVAAWARLVRAQGIALAQVEGALKGAEFPPLAWYDVLLELERARQPMRPGVLQANLLLAQYNLSRLLDRMAAHGLIERRSDATDARVRLVAVTPAGRRLRRRMWPVYADAIQRAVGDRLDAGERRALVDLLGKLLGR
jgi:DNA-binding MarR family transcriptional regulator